MSKRILSLVLAFVMVLGTFGTVFADVATTAVVNEKVQWLQDQGLVKGDQNGNLNLESKIDRASVAKLVVEALGKSGDGMKSYQGPFSDVSVSHWSNGNINMVYGLGLMKGNEGKFMPSNEISYAEVLTILVRMMDAEPANAVWPATHIAKAQELGIINGVEITDYMTLAVREDIFEMFYNVLTDKGVGNYTIVKGIVLENYRVETLDKDEVVVEVIKEIQTADYATTSRKEKGDQISLVIDAKVGDVEDLLGKVADFTLDKDGKVVKVTVDNSYKYEVGYISAKSSSLTINDDKTYTVVKDERYSDKDKDERIFASYFNNKDYSYTGFLATDGAKAEYARITTKNGKVLFIDAFQFDDIAPVQEVKNDGKTAYIYDDVRDGSIKKLEFNSKTVVIEVNGKNISVATLEDIEAMDVIHVVDNTVFVRKDAKVEGTYEKYTTSKINEATVKMYIDGEAYNVAFPAQSTKRLPVFSYDGELFNTLTTEAALSVRLEDLRDEEITILLDMKNNVQYIAAGMNDPKFVALFDNANKGDARLAKADGTKEIYSSTFDTKYSGVTNTTRYQNLYEFNAGDLVIAETTESNLNKLTLVKTRTAMEAAKARVVEMTSSTLEIEGGTKYYVEPSTKVFVNTYNSTTGARTIKGISVADLRKAYKINQSADGTWNSDVYVQTNTDNSKVADILVFTRITGADNVTDTVTRKVALIEGKDSLTYYMVLEDAAKNKTTHFIAKSDAVGIAAGDIISVKLVRDDSKDIDRIVKVLIPANAPVFKVTKINGRTYTLTDKNGVSQTRYLLGSAVVFGDLGVDEYVAVPAGDSNDAAINVIVEKTASAGRVSAPFGEWVPTVPPTTTGVVTYISSPVTSADRELAIGDTEYTISLGAMQFFDRYVSVGDKIAIETNAAGQVARVTVYDGNITVTANDSFEDLVIGGNLTVNSGITLNTKHVTVKGNTVVNGTIVSNTTFEGNVTVALGATGTFTNVTFKKALTVNGTAIFKNNVKVAGTITGVSNITVDPAADSATKDLVENAEIAEDKATAETALTNYLGTAQGYNYGSASNWKEIANLLVSGKTVTGSFSTDADLVAMASIYNGLGDKNVDGFVNGKDAHEYAIDSYVMNTFGRYLGALEYKATGTVSKIVYNGTEYTWQKSTGANLGLSGSNWADANGKTLVSTVVDNSPNRGIRTVSFKIVDANDYSVDVTFNAINVATKAQLEAQLVK